MSQDAFPLYEFDDLPIDPVEPGTNLLVAGPALAGTRELGLRLLSGSRRDEGVLFLAIDDSGEEIASAYESVGGAFDRSRMAIIQCGGTEADQGDENIRCVGSPSDLTGIGIEYSSLYESLYGEGIDRVRTGLFSVSTLLMYVDDMQAVYRFLHTLTGRVNAADGLGVCVVDPSSHDRQTLSSITQTFDGRIDLREEDGETEIRIRGLPDHDSEWQPLSG